MTKLQCGIGRSPEAFGVRHLGLIRHSGFAIRHFEGLYKEPSARDTTLGIGGHRGGPEQAF